MNFYVVYSIDLPAGEVEKATPKSTKFKCTHSFVKRTSVNLRFSGELTKDEFCQFVKDNRLIMTPHNTLGVLKDDEAWYPALEFLNKDNVNIFAYVTPLPEVEQRRVSTKEHSDRSWARLKKVMYSKFKPFLSITF